MSFDIEKHCYAQNEAEKRIEGEGLDWKDFGEWLSGQTGVVSSTGEFLIYKTDVERYISWKKHGKPTYFD